MHYSLPNILEKRRSGVPLDAQEEAYFMDALQYGPPDPRRIDRAQRAIGEPVEDDDTTVSQAVPMANVAPSMAPVESGDPGSDLEIDPMAFMGSLQKRRPQIIV